MFLRNLSHQPLPNPWIRLPRVGRIGEPLVPVSNERQRIGKLIAFDTERRARLAEQAIGGKVGGGRGLGYQRGQAHDQ